MTFRTAPLFSLLWSLCLTGCAFTGGTESEVIMTSPAQIDAETASPRVTEYEWMSIAQWYRMHADDVEVARTGTADVLFIGDSITESWDWSDGHDQVFQEIFGRYRTANFGIGGDQTQNLLWRLRHGLVGKLDPKVVVILIGVNNFNLGGHSAEEVFAGVKAVVAQSKINYPNAKILVNGIFPYNQSAASPSRALVQATNQLLQNLADGQDVVYRDWGELFLDQRNNIVPSLMGDFLHPSAAGMRLFGEQIEPIIADWLANAGGGAAKMPRSIHSGGRVLAIQSGDHTR